MVFYTIRLARKTFYFLTLVVTRRNCYETKSPDKNKYFGLKIFQ